ncbi:hypothetical protein TNCV_3063941 [Trichonephila clavipes]|nr:hypothetical protein TNCV_3063941 [Trichonephila clavipes]
MPGKKKSSLQEALELLESLPSENSDAPTDYSSEEEVTANIYNLLELSSDSEEDDEKIEQDPNPLYSENTTFPTSGCNKPKVIRQWKKRDVQTEVPIFLHKIWVCGYHIGAFGYTNRFLFTIH